jgi:DNA-binding response OmpR family regulator
MAVAEIEVSSDPGEIPVVVCIGLDSANRERVAQLIDGTGMLVVAPDLETAHVILGRQVRVAAPVPSRPEGAVVRFGDLSIDEAQCQVRWRGTGVELTKRDRDLLACLAGEAGRVWTYARLHAAAWDDRYIGDPAAVHAAIKRLRRKLREAGVGVVIESVRGVGYRLAAAPEPST